MTPSILLINVGLSFAALAALCLSLNRHHTEVFERKAEPTRMLLLRVLGWVGITLSFFLSGFLEGWDFGPVQWLGALTGAGIALVLLLSYRPRAVYPSAFAALVVAALGALLV